MSRIDIHAEFYIFVVQSLYFFSEIFTSYLGLCVKIVWFNRLFFGGISMSRIYIHDNFIFLWFIRCIFLENY